MKLKILAIGFFVLFPGIFHKCFSWQQEVSYKITVSLDDNQELLNGHEVLTYINRSPFTLHKIYFHLFQNAFQKGSYFDLKRRSYNNYSLASLKEEEEAYCKVSNVRDNQGNGLSFELDNTILAVSLNKPLPPGEKITLEMDFITKFGKKAYRMKAKNGQFVASQWYPKFCVFDDHGGWHLDQHYGHEFYGEFGTFDVGITLAADFIVGATGVLMNRHEVLPDSLMRELDIGNFRDKPLGQMPSKIITANPGETKTWKYHAENVHDFAWTADRTFRIGIAHWEDVVVYSLARESKAAKWQDAAEVGAETIQLFSEHFGRYPYPQMTIADVDQGMEYPMIVMCGGESPTYNGLFYHEIGHNWFYGVLGSNETAFPCMDEGFTVYLTDFALENLEDIEEYSSQRGSWYARKFFRTDPNFWNSTSRRYLQLAKTGYENKVLTHSDHCIDYYSYRNTAYSKPATTLRMLQGILGDEVFFNVMRSYFERWKFRHPYPEDFKRVAEEVSGRNLEWFFEQWWNSTKTCDYAVTGLRNKKLPDGRYQAQIELKRKGEIYMPIDLELILTDGSKQMYTIPIDEWCKQVDTIQVLPKWYGWDGLNRKYRAQIIVPQKVKKVVIDPRLTTADINYLNNRSGLLPKMDLHWDNLARNLAPLDAYNILWRPSFWYNEVDGLKTGLHLEGSYLAGYLPGDYATQLGLWYGPMSKKVNYDLNFETPLRRWGKLTSLTFTSSFLEGRTEKTFGFKKTVRKSLFRQPAWDFVLNFSHFDVLDTNYVLDPWEKGKTNTVQVSLSYRTQDRALKRHWHLQYRSTTFASDFNFDKVELTLKEEVGSRSDWGLAIRFYGGYSGGQLPLQEKFYLAAASPLENFYDPWYRSRGTLPTKWHEQGHLQKGGGANLRGYLDKNQVGQRLLAANLQLAYPNPLRPLIKALPFVGKIFSRINTYAFFDAGDVREDDFDFSLKYDAGLGFLWKFPFLPPRLDPVSIRVDFPIYVNRPRWDEKAFEFRWLVGTGKSF